jgi:DNA-directed RNA polymerase specialized sigma24 family protein
MAEHGMSEEKLVEALRAGNEEGIDELVELYRGIIHRIADHLCNDPQTAEEVVEEVLVRLCMEIGEHPERTLESLVHEFTYDASLGRLIGSVDQHLAQTQLLGSEVAQDLASSETTLVNADGDPTYYEPSLENAKVHLEEAIDLMGQAARLLNEVE